MGSPSFPLLNGLSLSSVSIEPVALIEIIFSQNLHSAADDLCCTSVGFHSQYLMDHLHGVQNKIMHIPGGYNDNTKTEQLHLENEILMLKTYI